jgi:hypothetical protein
MVLERELDCDAESPDLRATCEWMACAVTDFADIYVVRMVDYSPEEQLYPDGLMWITDRPWPGRAACGLDAEADALFAEIDTTCRVNDVANDGSDGGDSSSGPATGCGNGRVDALEQCDGYDLLGETCASLGAGTGTLSCSPTACVFDISMCSG